RFCVPQGGEYRVNHPSWDVFSVSQYDIQIDIAEVYGLAFQSALSAEPLSVFLADGSEISVEKGQKIS
ncbi:MAG: DUF2071 domain-containing protein, partial [Bacteroidota bacterium]